MKDNLVSIVVPIYNVEKYLQKCIDSLLNQTYKNIEIILVNDGTLDNSLKICEFNQKNDSRIKIISQKNGGLSKARNTGLENATGEYICFVDSDDYVNEFYVEKLLKNAIETNSDICACSFKYFDEDNNVWSREHKINKIFNKVDAIKDIFTGVQETEIMVWNKLYKRNLFTQNNITFKNGKINEDNFIMYQLYDKANQVCLINDELYYYLQRNTSIMGVKFNEKRFHILEAVDETKEYFKNKTDYNYEEELICYETLIITNLINTMIRSKYSGKEKKQLIDKLKKNKEKIYENKFLSKKKKLLIKLLINCKFIYESLVLLKRK